eukprot:3935496-Rhodomonas_salina.3
MITRRNWTFCPELPLATSAITAIEETTTIKSSQHHGLRKKPSGFATSPKANIFSNISIV